MSYLIGEYASRLNGSPIVAVIQPPNTKNRKIGKLWQLWVLPRDSHPAQAVKDRESAPDAVQSVCGTCPLIGAGCYVTVQYGPSAIWRAYKRGNIPQITRVGLANLIRGQSVRLGAYGDPAALPIQLLQDIVRYARRTVGYTHQWQQFRDVAFCCMASVETTEQAQLAQSYGFRTFRTRTIDAPLSQNEISCPASAESGKRLECADCMACHGNGTGRNISIIAHGSKATVSAYLSSVNPKE